MRIIDISRTISEDMVVYKDKLDKKPQIVKIKSFAEHGANESVMNLDSQTGTHADAFYHMMDNGKKIDQIPVDKFIGKCQVIDLTKVRNKITDADLMKYKISKNEIVLLKTKNYLEKEFDFNFTYLEKSGAEFLAKKGVRLVGIDQLSIEREQPQHETHIALFKKGIPIVEGLDLSKVKEGKYLFIGFPIKVKDGDGAPVRAVLVQGKMEG